MAMLMPNGKQQFDGVLGLPLIGGRVYTYAAGTNTPLPTFADAAGTIPNTNPVVLDARGEATIFWDGAYKVRLTDAFGIEIWTVDNITTIDPITDNLGTPAGAGLIGFSLGTGSTPTNLLARGRNVVFVTDFGAQGNDQGDQSEKIQDAADFLAARGGGDLVFPFGTFRMENAVALSSNICVRGWGGSVHWVNTTTGNAFQAIGTAGAMLENIHVKDLVVKGGVTFDSNGNPSNTNGSAFNFQFVSRSSVIGCTITGFSDNAVAFANGDLNLISGCYAEECGQSFSFYATTRGGFGNKGLGNTVVKNGKFNALHSEGRAAGGTADLIGTNFSDNTVDDSYGHCINIENSPSSIVHANRVRKAGKGTEPLLNNGIFLFGSPNSSVQGNVSTDNDGWGLYVSANCGLCSVDGNTTTGNALGSLTVTDGGGVAATLNVAIGVNSFAEGPAVISTPNVSFKQRIPSIQPNNVADPNPFALDWYEEGTFTPIVQGSGSAGTFAMVYSTGRFTRIGNVVTYKINLGWTGHTGAAGNLQIAGLPYQTIAADLLDAVTVWNNGLPYAANTKLQASIPPGTKLINMQTYTDTNGVAAAVPVPGSGVVVAGLTLTGSYMAG